MSKLSTISIASALVLFQMAATSGLNAQEQAQEQAPGPGEDAPPPPVIQTPPPSSNPNAVLLMTTGQDALAVCDDNETTRAFVCLGWIIGASAANGWTQTLEPTLMPDWCASRVYNLGAARTHFVDYLQAQSQGQLTMPAISLFRQAMAEEFPCKEGTLVPAE